MLIGEKNHGWWWSRPDQGVAEASALMYCLLLCVASGGSARLRGGTPSAAAAARLALEARGVRVLADLSAEGPSACYDYSVAAGLYRLLPTGAPADAALPRWVGGASSSYEAVSELEGLSFFALPDSEAEAESYAPREVQRYDAAWGDEPTDGGDVRCSASGYDITPMPRGAVEAAAAALPDDDARAVLLHGRTERPHSHNAWPEARGVYRCALGGLPLFRSGARVPSATGWPSFDAPLDEAHLLYRPDASAAGEARTEVLCARSRCHLGHVFALPGGGRRFCVNGGALAFDAEHAAEPAELVLAGGCFWGLQHSLLCAAGVVDAQAGYARLEPTPSADAGAAAAARSVAAWAAEPALPEGGLTYERVRSGSSGWVEAVRVRFNPETAPAPSLLAHFFRAHDARGSRDGQPWPLNYGSAILIPAGGDAESAAELGCAARESARAAAVAESRRSAGPGAPAPPAALATVVGGAADGLRVRFVSAEDAQQRYLAKRGKEIVLRRLPPPGPLDGELRAFDRSRRVG